MADNFWWSFGKKAGGIRIVSKYIQGGNSSYPWTSTHRAGGSGCHPAWNARMKIIQDLNMVPWNEKFSTGSSELDLQHRTLINNINHLEQMLTTTNLTREECEFLIHLVDFLETYADTHFNFEEQCMERYRCPAHQKNKQAHNQFRGFVQHF